jgi:2,3-dihydro-2,3-dihydroxybenzoate dehydrogenase
MKAGEQHFDGRIIVVTGAARGIGAAVAQHLALAGATIALLDRDAEVSDVAAAISALGGRALAYRIDVAEPGEVAAAAARIEAELGPIEGLAHVAGVLRTSSLLDVSAADFDLMFRVNTTGTFLVTREVGRRMAERRTGSIVVVTSNAATTPRIGLGAYAASKAAATMVARCLGLELAARRVRVNTVSPGSTDTEMLDESLGRAGSRDTLIAGDLPTYRVGIPLGRIATTADVAQAVAFLLSDSAQQITMADLRVDGGATFGG